MDTISDADAVQDVLNELAIGHTSIHIEWMKQWRDDLAQGRSIHVCISSDAYAIWREPWEPQIMISADDFVKGKYLYALMLQDN